MKSSCCEWRSPITKCKEVCIVLVGNDRQTHVAPTAVSIRHHFRLPALLPSNAGILDGLGPCLAYVARISTPDDRPKVHPQKLLPAKETRTLARSIGWMATEAKVAADPPQTKGSAVFAIPMVIAFFCGQKMAERDDRSAKCRSGRGTDRFFANLLFLSLFSSFFFYVVKNPKWPSTFLP